MYSELYIVGKILLFFPTSKQRNGQFQFLIGALSIVLLGTEIHLNFIKKIMPILFMHLRYCNINAVTHLKRVASLEKLYVV